ncbi:zinc ribbon domain-containing protein [Natronorubrum halophilum]|uniref:zinc ribbon domain-containing protein n=1 Tax=Natronorubrum halophilum TaxID=1702106 RepID=UPI000EF7089D|nr:zinc ribbon domain-containing protein [Natronorubrum halophilum]
MDGNRRSSRDGGESYCSNCGTELEPSMNYCPNCGTASGRSTARSRIGSPGGATTAESRARDADGGATDRDVLEYRIVTAARDGWGLEHDFGDHAVMVRRTVGSMNEHLVVALITIWFTGGLGNVLYGAYRYFGDAERIVLQADGVERSDADGGESIGSAILWRATAAFCWLVAAGIAVAGVYVGLAAASYVLFALAFVFAAMGVSVLPSVKRRVENRHSVTTNGRTHSVDERTVSAYDRPCSACTDPVGHGLERTYREEFCVLGVPLTASEGRNYYCRQCANADSPAAEASSRRTVEAAPDRETGRSPDSADGDRDPEPDHA